MSYAPGHAPDDDPRWDWGVFRAYAPEEMAPGKSGNGYPVAWSKGVQFHDEFGAPVMGGIKDLIRQLTGHRCIRCGHPYRVGQESIWTPGDNDVVIQPGPITADLFEENAADHLTELTVAADNPARIHWSACDEHCTHDGLVRFRAWGRGVWHKQDWALADYHRPDAAGMEVQAAYRILTVHHLDEDKLNCRWFNLVALCQRCHLNVQRRVEMHRPWPYEHREWFKPYVAGYYAWKYEGEEITRAQAIERMDTLLRYEHRQDSLL